VSADHSPVTTHNRVPFGSAQNERAQLRVRGQFRSSHPHRGTTYACDLACISRRLSSPVLSGVEVRSGGEGGSCKACDPSTSSGQAEATGGVSKERSSC
jgi:hypothetical protein